MDNDSSFEDFIETSFTDSVEEEEEPKSDVTKEDKFFEILSMDHLLKDVDFRVQQVKSFLQLPTTDPAIRVLLTHYKWDYQRLIAEYYELGESTFFDQAKVPNPFNSLPVCDSTDDSNLCEICYDDKCEDLFNMDCGHKYCRDCWGKYLTTKIDESSLTQLIVCPGTKCDFLVDDENVLLLVENTGTIEKYQLSMTNGFVQHNKELRWCPSIGCLYAVKRIRTLKLPCKCQCGFEFCFDCSAEYWHEPVTCSQLKQWKSSSDCETYKWICEHAKLCPSCDSIIEKNGGCNHMTCSSCKHEFCWICMKNWKNHTNCNRFDDTQTVKRLKNEFARFEHFQDRYGNQMESMRLEGNLYRDLNSKIDYLKETFSMTNNEVKFFRDAVKVLHDSRRTLTYSFVFAYFLKKNNQVEIFELNQSDLETAVEKLSGYMEQEMTLDNVVVLKRNIQESFKYCEQRCKVLKDHVREAEEKGLWRMN